MNEFKESLRAVENTYEKQGGKLDFQDKVALAVYNAILDLDTENEKEEIMKIEYLMNINKIICNYEELRPVMNSFFGEKYKNNKFGEKEYEI